MQRMHFTPRVRIHIYTVVGEEEYLVVEEDDNDKKHHDQSKTEKKLSVKSIYKNKNLKTFLSYSYDQGVISRDSREMLRILEDIFIAKRI